MAYAKGGDIQPTSYAEGGPVLGRTRDFMKEPDTFRGGRADRPIKASYEDPQDYEGGKPKGRDKSLPEVMPRT